MHKHIFTLAITTLFLTACTVGPNYVRPTLNTGIPTAFKESKDWKLAEPQDQALSETWWEIFNDPLLNDLIADIEISNQNLAQAQAQLRQAQTLVRAAQASYYPTVGASGSATRSGGNSNTNNNIGNSFNALGSASWEPDLWGKVQRTVEANQANAQASAANVQTVRLSAQAALAQNYLQLRVLDAQEKLLNETVEQYKKSYQLVQNQYAVGIVAKADVIQAETQLKSAQAQAIDVGVLRAQMEHAIALLIGQPASSFSITKLLTAPTVPPVVPTGVPSTLLERRPDVSNAERLVAAANAQIGVAQAAYFPSLTLSASGGFQNSSFANLISLPNRVWSLGPALAQTIFDGGLRKAQTEQAIANYDAAAANYKQTILASFQQVEDNLAALRILEQEAKVQNETVQSARQAVQLALNQYKAGVINYTNVATIQATALSAENTALNIQNRRLTATVSLIQALGGGWSQTALPHSENPK